MHPQPLIHSIVQQTMILVAHLATAGGVRAPLAHVANQVFADLTRQLTAQGVTKTVIADMFGMALSTYHRRVRAASESQTDAGRSVWEAVVDFIRLNEPVASARILARFSRDDTTVVTSVLKDLSDSGIVYRAGRGNRAVYRIANPSDFPTAGDEDEESDALRHILWLAIVRQGPITAQRLSQELQAPEGSVQRLAEALVTAGLVERRQSGAQTTYESTRFDVPVGTTQGWEAAVLDHFQAVVTALCVKLRMGAGSAHQDVVGGSTFTLDVWPGHPLEHEAESTLSRLRQSITDLRERIDRFNASHERPRGSDDHEVIVYVGQYLKTNDSDGDGESHA